MKTSFISLFVLASTVFAFPANVPGTPSAANGNNASPPSANGASSSKNVPGAATHPGAFIPAPVSRVPTLAPHTLKGGKTVIKRGDEEILMEMMADEEHAE